MLFSIIAPALLALVTTVLGSPVPENQLEARTSPTCKTILTGYLVGLDPKDKQFRFVYNDAHEVAYASAWNKSSKQIHAQFQQCANYKDPLGDDSDEKGYVGRMYVPSLKGCVSNPPYKTSLNTEYYPKITSCDKTTSTVGETELWKYFPSSDGDNNLHFVYWSPFPNRLRASCGGLFGYKTDGKADNLPYLRPGHNNAIDFKCDNTDGSARFFLEPTLSNNS